MMRYRCILFSVFFIAQTWQANAQVQRYKFTRINQLEEVSIGQVNAIAEDKNGFIWFSEEANGALTRFDGFNVKRYKNIPGDPNSLGGASPECILIDQNGIIWIGFMGQGVDRFDPETETFTHFRHDPDDNNSISNDYVSSIVEDGEGNLYIATFEGMNIYDSKFGTFTHYRHNPEDSTSLSSNMIRKIYIDLKGIVWVGTGWFGDPVDMGGLNRFDKKSQTFTRYLADPKDPTALINRRVTAILEDSKGNFWVGTGGDGLHSMDKESGEFTRHLHNPDDPNKLSAPVTLYNGYAYGVTFLAEDLSGNLWVGAEGFNVYNPEKKTMVHFGNNKDFYDTFIEDSSWCILIGSNGLIWISTQPGVYKIDPYDFTIPRTDGVIPSYLKESDSISWSGLNNGLLRENHNDGSKLRFIHDPDNPNSISNNNIHTIHKEQNGMIWVGTNNGLNRLEFGEDQITSFLHNPKDNTSISNNIITTITEDNRGGLWVGTRDGLNKWDKSKERFELIKVPDPGRYHQGWIQSLEMGSDDELWVAQFENATLVRIDTKTGALESFEIANGISDLLKDALGRIWVASPSGLYRYNKEHSRFNIISNRTMFAMIEDLDSNLWISSTSHLFRKKLLSNNLVQYNVDYVTRSGSIMPYKVGSYIHHTGVIILGDNKDYNVFNPKNIQMPAENARVLLTDFWIGEDLIRPSKSNLLAKSIMETNDLFLSYAQNTFSFSCTEIDVRNPGRNKIFYMLDDYDLNWRETFSGEKITYINVPPGQYIFSIRAPNSSTGLWAENKMSVFISPPWWRTWWAYCTYLIIIGYSVWWIHKYQKEKTIKKEREKTKDRELAQAKEIEKAYENLKSTQTQLIQSEKMASLGELTAGIAHEIQNPLNFVNNFSEVSTEMIDELGEELEKKDYEEAKSISLDIKKNLEKINQHGKRADSIVKGMLMHSRKSTGEKELTDIKSLCDEYLRLSYHGMRAKNRNFNAEYKTDFDPDLPKIKVVPQDIGRVLLNIINNAFQSFKKDEDLPGFTENKILSTPENPDSKDKYASSNQAGLSPKVIVTTKKLGDKIEITISDNGPGIPEEIKDKIFQPFFTTKATGEGTGLGLSLSYDIVKAHGGNISLERKDNWTIFAIRLPT